MKITTLQQNFGKSVTIFRGIELEFGNNGICEVEDEKLASEILGHYPELFWDYDVMKQKEPAKEKTVIDKVNENLEKEINSLKVRNSELERKFKESEADKAKWAELAVSLEDKVKDAEKAVEDIKITSENTIKGLELKIELIDSNVEGLKTVCRNAGYPEAEWLNKSKKDLIEYLLAKN